MHVTLPDDHTQDGLLSRLFQPERGDLAPDVARYLLSIDFAANDRNRMDELAEKSQAGELDYEERKELERYVYVGHVLAFMQSKARKSLKPSGSSM